MSVLSFIENMVGNIAWPAAAVILALMFRSQLGQLMGRVRHFEAAGGTVDFEAVPGSSSEVLHLAKQGKSSSAPQLVLRYKKERVGTDDGASEVLHELSHILLGHPRRWADAISTLSDEQRHSLRKRLDQEADSLARELAPLLNLDITQK